MFKKAVRSGIFARMALCGPTGSGKTFTALGVACAIATAESSRVAVIDTERSSANRYADVFDFDHANLEAFSPEAYLAAIDEAAKAGFKVLVIDSLSHAWDGVEGLLERVDNIAKRSKSGNSFNAWGEATPLHRRLVDSILSFPGHVLVTMRSKMEYVQEKNEATGKNTIRKVGMAPIQRQGIEYEFDLVGDMDQEHNLIMTKSRAFELADKVINRPGKRFAEEVWKWARGTAERETTPSNQKPPEQTAQPKTQNQPNSAPPEKPTEPPSNPPAQTTTSNQTTKPATTKAEKPPLVHYVCSGCAAITSSFQPVEKCRHCTIQNTTLAVFKALDLAKDHAKMINSQKAKAEQPAPNLPPAGQDLPPGPAAASQEPPKTPPVQPPAPSSADAGKKIVEDVDKIKRFVINLTGAKNRADISRELSALCKRQITGAADLCDAKERDYLIGRIDEIMDLPPEARPHAYAEWKGA